MSNRRTSAKRSSASHTFEALQKPRYTALRREQEEKEKREIEFTKLKNEAYERNKKRIQEQEITNETNTQENLMSFSPPPLFSPVANHSTPNLRINLYPGNPGGKEKQTKRDHIKILVSRKKEGYINAVVNVIGKNHKIYV